jgi:uncharacterized membrane protein
MNKTEFMNSLDISLGNISFEQKKEIMYDYEEHFSIGIENGKTQEQIAKDLGNPVSIAKQYRAECMLKNAEINTSTKNIFKAVLAVVGLGFFNLVFILGPFLGIVGVLIGLFAAAISIVISGAAVLGVSIFLPALVNYIPVAVSLPGGVYYSQTAMIFLSIGIGSMGLLATIGVWKLVKLFCSLTIRYLKFNINIVNK